MNKKLSIHLFSQRNIFQFNSFQYFTKVAKQYVLECFENGLELKFNDYWNTGILYAKQIGNNNLR